MLHLASRRHFAGFILPTTVSQARSRFLSRRKFHDSPSAHQHEQHIAAEKDAPVTIFSGIQPTGIPHLGNYLGALRQWVDYQDKAKPSTALYYSIVDLHSLTSRTQTPAERRLSKRQALASLLACGLDPDRSIIYHQSAVPQHAELHWILSCIASMGHLNRMTQWKSKLMDDGQHVNDPLSKAENPRSHESLKLGLYSYPVLQASDVLLYSTTHVPVGEDQVQHIEFARSIAGVFNATYGHSETKSGKPCDILSLPQCIVSPAKRIMSLTEPQKKMSKSHPSPRSRILLDDSPSAITKKIRNAVTDSQDSVTYDPVARPGVSNLLDMISYLGKEGASSTEVAKEIQSMPVSGSRMRVLKERAATAIEYHLQPIREKYEHLMGERDGRLLDEIALAGQEKARRKAEETMARVRDAVGIS